MREGIATRIGLTAGAVQCLGGPVHIVVAERADRGEELNSVVGPRGSAGMIVRNQAQIGLTSSIACPPSSISTRCLLSHWMQDVRVGRAFHRWLRITQFNMRLFSHVNNMTSLKGSALNDCFYKTPRTSPGLAPFRQTGENGTRGERG